MNIIFKGNPSVNTRPPPQRRATEPSRSAIRPIKYEEVSIPGQVMGTQNVLMALHFDRDPIIDDSGRVTKRVGFGQDEIHRYEVLTDEEQNSDDGNGDDMEVDEDESESDEGEEAEAEAQEKDSRKRKEDALDRGRMKQRRMTEVERCGESLVSTSSTRDLIGEDVDMEQDDGNGRKSGMKDSEGVDLEMRDGECQGRQRSASVLLDTERTEPSVVNRRRLSDLSNNETQSLFDTSTNQDHEGMMNKVGLATLKTHQDQRDPDDRQLHQTWDQSSPPRLISYEQPRRSSPASLISEVNPPRDVGIGEESMDGSGMIVEEERDAHPKGWTSHPAKPIPKQIKDQIDSLRKTNFYTSNPKAPLNAPKGPRALHLVTKNDSLPRKDGQGRSQMIQRRNDSINDDLNPQMSCMLQSSATSPTTQNIPLPELFPEMQSPTNHTIDRDLNFDSLADLDPRPSSRKVGRIAYQKEWQGKCPIAGGFSRVDQMWKRETLQDLDVSRPGACRLYAMSIPIRPYCGSLVVEHEGERIQEKGDPDKMMHGRNSATPPFQVKEEPQDDDDWASAAFQSANAKTEMRTPSPPAAAPREIVKLTSRLGQAKPSSVAAALAARKASKAAAQDIGSYPSPDERTVFSTRREPHGGGTTEKYETNGGTSRDQARTAVIPGATSHGSRIPKRSLPADNAKAGSVNSPMGQFGFPEAMEKANPTKRIKLACRSFNGGDHRAGSSVPRAPSSEAAATSLTLAVSNLDPQDLRETAHLRLHRKGGGISNEDDAFEGELIYVIRDVIKAVDKSNLKYRSDSADRSRQISPEDEKAFIKEFRYRMSKPEAREFFAVRETVNALGTKATHRRSLIEYYVYHRDILAQSSLDIMRSTTPANGRYFYDRQATSASARSFHDRTDHQEDKHHTCEICGARIKGGESRLRTHKNRSEACKAIAEKQKRRGLTSGGSRDGHLAAKIIRKSDPSQKKIEIEGEEEEAEEDEEQMEKEDKSCANGTRMETDAMEVDDQGGSITKDDDDEERRAFELALFSHLAGEEGEEGLDHSHPCSAPEMTPPSPQCKPSYAAADSETPSEGTSRDRTMSVDLGDYRKGLVSVSLDSAESRDFAEYAYSRWSEGWEPIISGYEKLITATLLTKSDLTKYFSQHGESFTDKMDNLRVSLELFNTTFEYRDPAACEGCDGNSPSLRAVVVGSKDGEEVTAVLCQLCRKGCQGLQSREWKLVDQFFQARKMVVKKHRESLENRQT